MTSNHFWRPPKWTPELAQFLARKIVVDWEPTFGNQIHCSLDSHPLCRGIEFGAQSYNTKCLLPADWWHPITNMSYCSGCISLKMRRSFYEMWQRTRICQIHEILPSIGVNVR